MGDVILYKKDESPESGRILLTGINDWGDGWRIDVSHGGYDKYHSAYLIGYEPAELVRTADGREAFLSGARRQIWDVFVYEGEGKSVTFRGEPHKIAHRETVSAERL